MGLALIVLVWALVVVLLLIGLALFSVLVSYSKLLDAQAAAEARITAEVNR